MTAHQTRDAVAIAMRAYDHAIRLGHRHFGIDADAVLSRLGVSAPAVRAAIAGRYSQAS
jgi:hypothetical protein